MSFFSLAALRKKLHLVHAENRAAKNKTYPLGMTEDPTARYWENIRRRLKEIKETLDGTILREVSESERRRLEAEQAELNWLVETGTVRL